MGWFSRQFEGAVETAVRVVSPRRAAQRAHFSRMATDKEYAETIFALMSARGYRKVEPSTREAAGGDERGYKSANIGLNDGKWTGGWGSGDWELTWSLLAMRNRSRELDRDDSIGSGIFNTMVQQIIGRELRPQAKTGDRHKNKSLEAIWNERKRFLFPAESQSIGRVQRRACRRKLVDGDIFIKPAKDSADDPVWFELVEGDRVRNPVGLQAAIAFGPGVVFSTDLKKNWIKDGVEKDEWSRLVAVYILKKHPGDPFSPMSFRPEDFMRVMFGRYYHSQLGDRTGLTRGEPLLHAVMQDVRDLDTLVLASMKRAQVAACLALFIESEQSLEETFSATADKYGYRLDQDIEPGMIFKLFPGEKVSTLVPNFPVPELVPFMISIASRIGASIGLTWQFILKDFSRDSYSSARTGQLACEPTWDQELQDEIETLWTPIWVEVLEDARLRGDPRMEGILPAEVWSVAWQGDGRPWVDPRNQAEAKKIARQLGIESYMSQCAEVGANWEDNLDDMAHLIEECKARKFDPAHIDQLVFGVEKKSDTINAEGQAGGGAARELEPNGLAKRESETSSGGGK